MLPSCRVLRLACFEKPLHLPIGAVVTRIGQEIAPGVKVVFARPIPSIVTTHTEVTYVDRYDMVVEELKSNVLVKLRYRNYTEYLVYPKQVWSEVSYRYIEPLSEGKVPKEPGLLLYGPPGTGKTSMIELLANTLGLYTVDVTPDKVLSKYVGESERHLVELLSKAECNEPSIVKMDDAEWLVKSREFTMVGEATMVSLSLLNILLYRIPLWKRMGKRILAVVATNISPSKIDPALLRSGRLGKPVFVPLPDFEGIYTMMQVKGLTKVLGHERCEELARKLCNLGVNMADVVRYIEDYLAGKEPRLEAVKGRGYIRPVPQAVTEVNLKPLTEYIPPTVLTNPRTRIGLIGPTEIAEPLIVTYLAQIGRTSVLLTDERLFDEAVTTAETCRATLIVDCSVVRSDVVKIIHSNCSAPVIYLAPRGDVPCLPIDVKVLTHRLGKCDLIKLVLSYYNVQYSEAEVKRLAMCSDDELLRALRSIRYMPCIPTEVRKLAMYMR